MRSMMRPPKNLSAYARLKDAWDDTLADYDEDPIGRIEVAECAARELLAIARTDAGRACKACGGRGSHAYGNTSTWRGGVGGCAITVDVCDQCWGTGRYDDAGPDLRAQELELQQLRETRAREASSKWFAEQVGSRFITVKPHLLTIAAQLTNKRGDDYWLQRCRDKVRKALELWGSTP